MRMRRNVHRNKTEQSTESMTLDIKSIDYCSRELAKIQSTALIA
jgi:hypothetical protein